jgi:hypothetical protein
MSEWLPCLSVLFLHVLYRLFGFFNRLNYFCQIKKTNILYVAYLK